jgi:hypothetical protein
MGELISGDDDFPEELTIPDDSDPATAAAVNPGTEALANRTRWLKNRVTAVAIGTAVSSGTVTAPERAFLAILEGCGGGGGGGAGANNPGADSHGSGGGGGGGAVQSTRIVPVVGGEDYEIVIGAGGVGGTQEDGDPFPGGVGGDTTFSLAEGPVLLATFRGAGGGHQGESDPGLGPNAQSYGSPGLSLRFGSDAAGSGYASVAETEDQNLFLAPACPSGGAAGVSSNNNRLNQRAASSPQGFVGGPSGDVDATSDSVMHGGGSGGGGGAGPYGDGAAGGDGGAPNNSGDGESGTAGASAASNTGAGGGGGGGSGGGATSGGIGGDGGGGGSGRLKITWLCLGGTE